MIGPDAVNAQHLSPASPRGPRPPPGRRYRRIGAVSVPLFQRLLVRAERLPPELIVDCLSAASQLSVFRTADAQVLPRYRSRWPPSQAASWVAALRQPPMPPGTAGRVEQLAPAWACASPVVLEQQPGCSVVESNSAMTWVMWMCGGGRGGAGVGPVGSAADGARRPWPRSFIVHGVHASWGKQISSYSIISGIPLSWGR